MVHTALAYRQGELLRGKGELLRGKLGSNSCEKVPKE
jgi:hypothetical protein